MLLSIIPGKIKQSFNLLSPYIGTLQNQLLCFRCFSRFFCLKIPALKYSYDMLGSNPLPPFQPIKSQARSAELRHIFPALAISSMNSLSDRFLCLLCLSFAILSFPVKNKNGLCDIAITHTRLSIVLYEFLLSILNTKRNSMQKYL